MNGQAHKDILLADVDQLAKEIIRKKGVVFQFQLCELPPHFLAKACCVTSSSVIFIC
jgi:hypothetical protein